MPGLFRNLAMVVGVTACVAGGPTPVTPESALATRVLEDALTIGSPQDTVILLDHFAAITSGAPDSSGWLAGLLPTRVRGGVPAELFYRYWRANRTSENLIVPKRINGLSVRQTGKLSEDTLRARGGVYSLSRIGFSAGSDSALVMVRYVCPGLCGTDYLYLYVRGIRGWTRHRTLLSINH